MAMQSTMDCESQEVKGFDFSDQSIRRSFIKKVYSILMVQLSITMGLIAWFLFHEPTRLWVCDHPIALIIAVVVVLVAAIILGCCGNVRRKSPTNYILLIVFTLAEGFMVAFVASFFEVYEVLIAAGITLVVCLGLTLFAFQTKWDFTLLGVVLLVFSIILILFGIASIFLYSRIWSLVYSAVGALIFSLYLVYDAQVMMGGGHRYSISPEEYVFAALNLYLDIITIFLYILYIIALAKR